MFHNPGPNASRSRAGARWPENHAGRFPLWLAPLQVVVATITSEADGYARQVMTALEAAGLKAEIDLRNEKINYKVREHSHAKVPVMLVVGAREAAEDSVAVRRLGGKAQEVLALQEAVARLASEAAGPLAGASKNQRDSAI